MTPEEGRGTVGSSSEHLYPFARSNLIRRILPFVSAAVMGIVLIGFSNSGDWLDVMFGIGVVATVVAAIRFIPWSRLPTDLQVLPLVWWIAGVALLNGAFHVEQQMTRLLLLLPILWAAIYHTRRHLYAVVLATLAVGFASRNLIEGESSWPVFAMPIVVVLPIAFTIQTFARQVRETGRLSEEAALEDPLTELANRRRLDLELPRALQMAHRTQRPFSLLMLDLDHFKSYNDTYGHTAGDALLESLARVWTTELRLTDLLIRYGGDEFLVLLPGCGEAGAHEVAVRFMQSIPEQLSCSIGIALYLDGETPEEIIERSDAAAYRAKQQGGAGIVVWDSTIDAPSIPGA